MSELSKEQCVTKIKVTVCDVGDARGQHNPSPLNFLYQPDKLAFLIRLCGLTNLHDQVAQPTVLITFRNGFPTEFT